MRVQFLIWELRSHMLHNLYIKKKKTPDTPRGKWLWPIFSKLETMPLPMRPRPKNPILERQTGQFRVGNGVEGRTGWDYEYYPGSVPLKPGEPHLSPPRTLLCSVLIPRPQSQQEGWQSAPFLTLAVFRSAHKFTQAFLNHQLPLQEV